jgi:hypothetical protein
LESERPCDRVRRPVHTQIGPREVVVQPARITVVAGQLRATCAILALALLAMLPVAALVLGAFRADVFPSCTGTIEEASDVTPTDLVIERDVLLAFFTLTLAAIRARRGAGYAREIHAWTAARIQRGGRVESEAGETLGMIAGAGRPLEPGPVLLSPEARARARAGQDVYRDLPTIARHDIALGTHEEWRAATLRGLRDARVLAVVSAVCTALALAARALGS